MFRFGPKKKMRDGNRRAQDVKRALGSRSLVLVGMMGCGKTAVGRRLATTLDLPFVDADDEIEHAAGRSIREIFEEHGEAYFREGERKVIARLLGGGPNVLATGGGAFMDATTRTKIRESGISIWLRADLPLLMRRVTRRDDRPLLQTENPEARMRELMAARHPVYAEAQIVVESRDVSHEAIVADILDGLMRGPLADAAC